MTWVNCNPNSKQEQAYTALQQAAERMGRNNYESQYKKHIKSGKSKNTFRFHVTPEHALVMEYMQKVLGEEITPEDVYALLWHYGVKKQRIG